VKNSIAKRLFDDNRHARGSEKTNGALENSGDIRKKERSSLVDQPRTGPRSSIRSQRGTARNNEAVKTLSLIQTNPNAEKRRLNTAVTRPQWGLE